MKKAHLGKLGTGGEFKMDIGRLLDTRLLLMASSGGGKSWTLRKIIEEIYGEVQVIVLDIEGEFGTLREKFDFVVAGKGGDITTDPRYADTLARKALELRVDMICDLYELKHHERIRFVRLFLEAMINAPKELWHPVVVVLDEAHIFAPEQGSAESLGAVIEMLSRGRKRGFCMIPATQRLSKLHKDVAAECRNKLIGLANLDVDRKRAADELGFHEKEKVLSLRDLNEGEFYAVGPAFGRGVQLATIGQVKTHHPKSGAARLKIHTPAPTAKIKAALAKLADVPAEAEQEAVTLQELKTENRRLASELRMRPTVGTVSAPTPAKPTEKQLKAWAEQGKEEGRRFARKALKQVLDALKEEGGALWGKATHQINAELNKPGPVLKPLSIDMRGVIFPSNSKLKIEGGFLEAKGTSYDRANPHGFKPLPVAGIVHGGPVSKIPSGDFGKCERAILGVLAAAPGRGFSRGKIAARSGYSVSSGGFNNSIGALKTKGAVVGSGDQLMLGPGIDPAQFAGEQPLSPQDWLPKLGKCEREIFEVVLANPEGMTREAIAAATKTGYSASSGGFNNSVGRLNTLGLTVRGPEGKVVFNREFF